MKWIKKNLNEILVSIIGGIILFVIKWFYNFIIYQINIKNNFNSLIDFLQDKTAINNFILIIVFLIIIIFLVVIFINRIRMIKKIKKEKHNEIQDIDYFRYSDTPSFFDYRLGQAFPSFQDLFWINNSKEAMKRLSIFLKSPLRYRGSKNTEITPIWWTRDISSSEISSFKIINFKNPFKKTKILINNDEMIIDKIAVYKSARRYLNFIYVEVNPDKQIGIYNYKKNDIDNQVIKFGYASEEFALYNNKTPIHINEYNDGAAQIGNKIVEVKNAKIRRRFLSKYNIIICPHQSVFNLERYSSEYNNICNQLLNEEITIERLTEIIQAYRKDEIIKY